MQKLIFWYSGSVSFFWWQNPGGSIRNNGKLTGHVCFVNQALLFLMESAKNHVLNTMNQTVVIHVAMMWGLNLRGYSGERPNGKKSAP